MQEALAATKAALEHVEGPLKATLEGLAKALEVQEARRKREERARRVKRVEKMVNSYLAKHGKMEVFIPETGKRVTLTVVPKPLGSLGFRGLNLPNKPKL